MPVASWSLTASSNATADAAINWQEGQNPSTVNDSARAMMAATKAAFNDLGGVSALGGSGNTFTLALSQTLPALTNGVTVGFIATRSNTGAVTLNVDARGAKPLRAVSGTDLPSGQIINGAFYVCTYYASTQEWLIAGNGTVSNAQLATMTNRTVKANISGSTAVPSDVALDTLVAATTDGVINGSKLTDATVTYGKLASAAIGDAAAYRAKTASKVLTTSVWDAAATVALTYGASVAVDLSTGLNFTLTLTGNAALSNPTNVKVGQSGFIVVSQDATGGRALTFGSNYKFVDGTAPTADTTASRKNVYTYVALSATEIWVTMARGVR